MRRGMRSGKLSPSGLTPSPVRASRRDYYDRLPEAYVGEIGCVSSRSKAVDVTFAGSFTAGSRCSHDNSLNITNVVSPLNPNRNA